MCSIINPTQNILSYESDIWKSCDVIRGHVKESNLPNLMMPFLALVMVESRLVRQYQNAQEELLNSGRTLSKEELHAEVVEEIKDAGKGYNAFVVEQDKRLINVCESSVHFETALDEYLNAYDDETKMLLGIGANNDQHYLNLYGNIKLLKSKKVLFPFVSAWAAIDLTNFNNSEITTLEEHIKRKWADISADTAGEQYTPDDIISLISDLCVSYVNSGAKFDRNVALYDMTCGGGNMVYGIEDRLVGQLTDHHIESYGQEINDQLYALAKIESRFRNGGEIVLGDTLLNDKLVGQDMDLIVANPPYGVDWSSIQTDVLNDKTGRYQHFPSKSDGQLLFVQHAVSKLKAHGKAIIVLNGSPMFSGDVNSGEAQTRKWLLDNDYVEAWIQLPKDEFFNTQITTYLWVLNKQKPESRKDKILLINAADKFKKLKKSKGKKTNEISEDDRAWIVEAFEKFETQGDNVKVVPKWDFYYNKQQLTLITATEDGLSVNDRYPNGFKVAVDRVFFNDQEFTCDGFEFTKDGLKALSAKLNDLKDKASVRIEYSDKAGPHGLEQTDDEYCPVIILEGEVLGAGKITFRPVLSGGPSTPASFSIKAEVSAIQDKDYEIIPYSPDADNNEAGIQEFIKQWVRRQYILGENSVGVEVNFNKIFYKPVLLRSTKEIAAEIKIIDADMAKLEVELWG